MRVCVCTFQVILPSVPPAACFDQVVSDAAAEGIRVCIDGTELRVLGQCDAGGDIHVLLDRWLTAALDVVADNCPDVDMDSLDMPDIFVLGPGKDGLR